MTEIQRERGEREAQRRQHDIALLPHHEMRFGNSKLELIIIHMDRQTGRQAGRCRQVGRQCPGAGPCGMRCACGGCMKWRQVKVLLHGSNQSAWAATWPKCQMCSLCLRSFVFPSSIMHTIHTYIWFFLHSLCQLINFSYFPLCPLPQAMPNYVIKSVFNNYAFPGTAQQTVETSAHARFMWMALLYRYRDTYAYMYITAIKFTAMRRSYPFSNSLLLFQVVLVEFITRSHTKQLLIALRAVNKLNTIYIFAINRLIDFYRMLLQVLKNTDKSIVLPCRK